jgi:hypothetical protein
MSASHGDQNEERLAGLISALPPAPEAWEQAAKDLPRAETAFDQILARAAEDDEFRMMAMDHPEDVLREAGCEPVPAAVSALRSRLTRPSPGG